MYIYIFEGIATSGKSSVIAALKERLADKKVVVFGEADTHIPIKDDRKELHLQFFSDLVNRALGANADVVLFDRLYMTQAFRAGANMADYADIEQRLQARGAETILLEVDVDSIAERLGTAMEHRDPAWRAYLDGKGNSTESVATLYAAQQYRMLESVRESLLPVQIFNTTSHGYARIADAIRAKLAH
jgi:thymidylate kinase